MSGGQFKVALVICADQGAGAGFGTQHSEAWFLQAPGLKVVVPGTPRDAYGLLRAAIRDDNPVVFLEHKLLLNMSEDVSDQDLHTLAPLDRDAILTSVAKTGRLVVVEESVHSAGWGGYIVSLIADEGIYLLEAPVKRVNMGAALVAYSPPLEDHGPERITENIRIVINQ